MADQDIRRTFTHGAALGMHGPIVRANKPAVVSCSS
ncbi:MAG: hypothetical protein JWM76_183 [Pseudonocardiales bacterium]|nr:hypothetical protein [Pseudonocardiales bacterium]